MIKKIFLFKSLIAFFFLNLTFTLCSFQPSKKTDEIVLLDETFAFTPKEFFIADVIDDRGAKDPVIPGNSIKGFIRRNLEQNKAFRPLIVHIKQLKLTETPSAAGKLDGRIDLSLQFDLEKGDAQEIFLTSYKSTATYTRSNGHIQDAEPALRRMLVNGLAGFNNWMNREADKNILLAKKVKVLFTDYNESLESDSIYYTANRPLSWADFKGNVPASHFDAEVYATIGYNENVEIVKGVVNVYLAVKVCLPKSASWVKPGRKTPYALNHEQRHFDIAKIAGEKFKQKVNAELLPVDNYDGPINVVYLDAYREMTDIEKLYDDQTSHGTNVTEQERWNKKIDEELIKLGVK